LSAAELAPKFVSILQEAKFLIAEINLNNTNGWVPKIAWDWIYTNHEEQPSAQMPMSDMMKLLFPPKS
jgi:hypothetical protein